MNGLCDGLCEVMTEVGGGGGEGRMVCVKL